MFFNNSTKVVDGSKAALGKGSTLGGHLNSQKQTWERKGN